MHAKHHINQKLLRTPEARAAREQLIQERNARIVELYQKGYTAREIAAMRGINLTSKAIIRVLQNAGVALRPRGRSQALFALRESQGIKTTFKGKARPKRKAAKQRTAEEKRLAHTKSGMPMAERGRLGGLAKAGKRARPARAQATEGPTDEQIESRLLQLLSDKLETIQAAVLALTQSFGIILWPQLNLYTTRDGVEHKIVAAETIVAPPTDADAVVDAALQDADEMRRAETAASANHTDADYETAMAAARAELLRPLTEEEQEARLRAWAARGGSDPGRSVDVAPWLPKRRDEFSDTAAQNGRE